MAIKWIVRFKDSKKEVEVEAEDRWGAISSAVEKLKLPGNINLTYWALNSSVRKVERKKRLAWWEK